ncbi:MAG TPA: DUF1554 domain-containing protein [Myxococcaceae bacterium]|jgi:hypothetical protein
MARSGPVVLLAAAAVVVACTFTFDVPDTAQIACADGGAPCPDGWDCDVSAGRCVVHGSVPEVPEIRVTPSAALATTEAGSASLAVRLGATPTAQVRILVVSSRPAEATVFPPELIFTSDNWNQPQTITVQGVDDSEVDGAQPYEVVLGPPVTNDARFAALPEIRIPGTNADTDTAELKTAPTSITTSESDTVATPSVGQVTLSSRPSGAVVIPVSSSDVDEATVFPPQLAFDAGNWNAPQTFRVVGVDDQFPIADGKHPYTVHLGPATSTDPHFQGATADIPGFNDDNDSPGIRIQPVSGLYTYEPTGSTYFSISLFTQPTSDVTITFTTLTPNQVTVNPLNATVTFDAGTWDQYQYVSLEPVDDPYDELPPEAPWTVQSSNSVSSDPNYSGLDVSDITGFNVDDEDPAVLFDGYTSGYSIYVDENAAPQTYLVTLRARPHGQVTIRPASANTSRVLVSPSAITLDGNTWSTGLPMTVTPVDNQARENDQYVDITFSVTASLPAQDPGYQNLMAYPMYMVLQDDERVIFTLSTARAGDMTDPGGTYLMLDTLCSDDPVRSTQNLNYVQALIAADYQGVYYFQRVASQTANLGDGQVNWVLQSGKNYVSETRTGPVIGRANMRNLFDFPLAHALGPIGDAWTGLNADWTSATENCDQWTNPTVSASGSAGGTGATNSTAIFKGSTLCNVPHRLLCVEQY